MRSATKLRIRRTQVPLRPRVGERSVNELAGGPQALLAWLETQLGFRHAPASAAAAGPGRSRPLRGRHGFLPSARLALAPSWGRAGGGKEARAKRVTKLCYPASAFFSRAWRPSLPSSSSVCRRCATLRVERSGSAVFRQVYTRAHGQSSLSSKGLERQSGGREREVVCPNDSRTCYGQTRG